MELISVAAGWGEVEMFLVNRTLQETFLASGICGQSLSHCARSIHCDLRCCPDSSWLPLAHLQKGKEWGLVPGFLNSGTHPARLS